MVKVPEAVFEIAVLWYMVNKSSIIKLLHMLLNHWHLFSLPIFHILHFIKHVTYLKKIEKKLKYHKNEY